MTDFESNPCGYVEEARERKRAREREGRLKLFNTLEWLESWCDSLDRAHNKPTGWHFSKIGDDTKRMLNR